MASAVVVHKDTKEVAVKTVSITLKCYLVKLASAQRERKIKRTNDNNKKEKREDKARQVHGQVER